MTQADKFPDEESKSDPVLPPSDEARTDDVLSSLDQFQKQMETDWETVKSSYQSKINHIMDEFIQDKMTGKEKNLSVILPSESEKKDKKNKLESLLEKAEQIFHTTENKAKLLS